MNAAHRAVAWWLGAVAAGLIAAGAGMGCAAPKRPVMTEAEFGEMAAADAAETEATFRRAVDKLLARIEWERGEVGEGGTIDLLALSGGGEYGAFGAGFLVGWGGVGDPRWRRPEFDMVSGVSTGALLAPFAFVGTERAYLEVERFYRNPEPDWVRPRGLLYFLPFRPSFWEIPGLERDIRAAVDEGFVAALAAASREGRVLAISATNLDLGRQKFWDLGVEAEAAEAAGTAGALDRVQRVLMASAAVPAFFPPVEIDGLLYADGGVTANVFLRLDPRRPGALIPRWIERHPGEPLPRIRYWIIINNQLHQPPETVQVRWPAVVAPSLATAIRSATLSEVRWLAAQADYVNAVYGTEIEVLVTAIPDEWRAPVEGEFQRETMQSLADLGRTMGADPGSWRVWASPERSRGRRPAALRE